eukprot:gnl/MRDRNA2_/MRDRNA2_14883_c0_seq1.p1 gnl/MRDRNA2_/MRDRNA2_14883_c0~~gnl/MRDRNA2_/MRDRNA2_14883_c0_seq1.p1  ORF type:complete len:582 (-),score=83.12 gnl/MRDRNA2_/MRDRNA2_14883_c0_seq1:6-1553(-)
MAATHYGLSPNHGPDFIPDWRFICAHHERIGSAWRHGSPVLQRLTLREELRMHELSDLEAVSITFLSGGDAFVIGHTHGVLSLWNVSTVLGANSFLTQPPSDAHLPPVPSDSHADRERSDSDLSGRSRKLSDVGIDTSGLQAHVIGVFKTCWSFDVHDVAVAPSVVAHPSTVHLGRSVWIAAAVGPSVFIWESINPYEKGKALGAWELRATLKHSKLFRTEHEMVWSVKLCESCPEQRRAITCGEDAALRVWRFDESEPIVLWEMSIGNPRQAIVCFLPGPPSWSEPDSDVHSRFNNAEEAKESLFVAVARADRRSLEVLNADAGTHVVKELQAWSREEDSLPQAGVFDPKALTALFSSVTQSLGGILSFLDLSPVIGNEGCDEASIRPCLLREGAGAFTAAGRVVCGAFPVPVAQMLVAIVREDTSKVYLEVWDRMAALAPARGLGRPHATARLQVHSYLGNPRNLLAIGGNRVALLDPSEFLSSGQLRILEWKSRGLRKAVPSGFKECTKHRF